MIFSGKVWVTDIENLRDVVKELLPKYQQKVHYEPSFVAAIGSAERACFIALNRYINLRANEH